MGWGQTLGVMEVSVVCVREEESDEHDIAGTEMMGSVLTDFCHGGLDSAGKKAGENKNGRRTP